MSVAPQGGRRAAVLAQQIRESAQALATLEREFPDNPAAMDYFYKLFHRVYCEGERAQPGGVLIGTTCVQVPDEIVRAAGGVPVRLCSGSHAFDQAGADFMPAKSCSLVKATLGVLQDERPAWIDTLERVVNLTTCDQKKKAGQMMEDLGCQVHHLEFPPSKDSEHARAFWRASVRDFVRAAERMTGGRVTRTTLRESILAVSRAQAAYRRLQRLRAESPALLLGKDAFLVTNAYFFDDLERWTGAVDALVAELEARREAGISAALRRAPRILFTGSPPVFPNLKIPVLVEQAGGVIVADETCSANRMLNDAVSVDEWNLYDMVDAVADRYLKPCTCPIFTSNGDRLRRLLDLARTHAVDGVVYQAFAGCQVYEMEHHSVSRALAGAGLPCLYVETDYSPDDVGQLSTRVEAFIESLRSRRRRRQ